MTADPLVVAMLESLRWREDMVVVNPFGERVWLKVLYDATGVRIGITDCCFEDDSCERHKTIGLDIVRDAMRGMHCFTNEAEPING